MVTPAAFSLPAAPPPHPGVGRHRRFERIDDGGIPGDVDCDEQRTVGAVSEALGDQIVGPALGPGFGNVPSSAKRSLSARPLSSAPTTAPWTRRA